MHPVPATQEVILFPGQWRCYQKKAKYQRWEITLDPHQVWEEVVARDRQRSFRWEAQRKWPAASAAGQASVASSLLALSFPLVAGAEHVVNFGFQAVGSNE